MTSKLSKRDSTSTIVSTYSVFQETQYCSIAARALFIWDYFITLDQEIQYIWRRRLSAVTCLFLLNRYVNFLVAILEILEQASFQTQQSCGPYIRVLQSLLFFTLLIDAAFPALRIYATWCRDWRPAIPILILSLVSPILTLYYYINSVTTVAPPPYGGCAIDLRISSDAYNKIIYTNRACTTASDFLMVVFTIARSLGVRNAVKKFSMNPDIVTLLLRDGSIYFAVLFVLNIAQIIVSAEQAGNNELTFFLSPVTSILISRFLLSLREIHPSDLRERQSTGSAVLSTQISAVPVSSQFIGSLGTPLWYTDSSTDDSQIDQKLGLPIFVREPLMAGLVPHDRNDEDGWELAVLQPDSHPSERS